MVLRLVLLAACALATASARLVLPGSHKFHAPAFCHDKACPPFKNYTKDTPYEVRDYRASTWAAFNTTDGFVVSEGKAYTQLTRYFKGANVDDAHIDLTTPAVTKFFPTDADFSGSKDEYVVAFYLPEAAPKPQVDGVYLKDFPASTAYVRSFGGYGTEATILAEAKTLRDQLLHDKVDIDPKSFAFATYDSAARLFDRHNEVWFFPGVAQLAAPLGAAEAAAQRFQAASGSLVDALYHQVKALLG